MELDPAKQIMELPISYLSTSPLEKVIDILETYNVQDWKKDYSYEDLSSYQDGSGWSLYLQFEDGTVEVHRGFGSFAGEIIPENFDDFFSELSSFVDERLGDGGA